MAPRIIRATLDGGQNFGRLRRPENFDILELETLISKGKTLKFSASGGEKINIFVRIYWFLKGKSPPEAKIFGNGDFQG